jgi:hypothetical protein
VSASAVDHEQALADRLASFRHDPLGAILYAFPWGEPGTELALYPTPRKWQMEEWAKLGAWLQNPETRYKPYRLAISSGHGPGKTTFEALTAWWAQSTFLDSMLRVTANTKTQLDQQTSPEFSRWYRRAINAHWFQVNVASIKAEDEFYDHTWRLDFVPWSDENPQAFAGKHNAGRRFVALMDEASEISDEIFRVTNGAMTDANTELIWLAMGNPTRNIGAFYEAVFGAQRDRWHHRVIDSRDVEGCNVEEINGWLNECDGDEDADYFRVRARGLFPKGQAGQFIDLDTIRKAQERAARCLADDPLIAGVDLAWGGGDDNVIRFRKGLDARSIPPIKIKGEFTRDPAVMTGKLADVLTKTYSIGGKQEKVAMMFMDAAGAAGPVAQRVRQLGHKNVMEVNFGQDALDPHFCYRRDEMWGKMKQALIDGLAIDKDPGLAADLAKPMLVSEVKQRVKLESKEIMARRLRKQGMEATSPDDADALALTYAMPVAPTTPKPKAPPRRAGAWS